MPELFREALDLAVVGMGTVFVFLTALVILTALMSRLAMLLGDEEEAIQATGQRVNKNDEVAPELLAAISAAVKQYRQRH